MDEQTVLEPNLLFILISFCAPLYDITMLYHLFFAAAIALNLGIYPFTPLHIPRSHYPVDSSEANKLIRLHN